jgi:hemoglobin-like flavoprotein
MFPDHVDAVERTFAKLAPITQATGVTFYSRLFEIDPSARALFGADMESQARKLMQVLAFAVNNLRDPDTLLPVVRDLGRRHGGYGVEAPHYVSVRSALMATLKESLGDVWTKELEAAWHAAYATITDEMMAAAREAEAS